MRWVTAGLFVGSLMARTVQATEATCADLSRWIRAVAGAAEDGVSEEEMRHIMRKTTPVDAWEAMDAAIAALYARKFTEEEVRRLGSLCRP